MALKVITPIQMRFADIDSFSHVNNIAQQSYFDLGKSEFFQRLWQLAGQSEPTPVVMVSLQTDFLAQILYGDKVEVVTTLKSIGHTSLTLEQQIMRGEQVCTRSRTVMVCFDKHSAEAVEVPALWRKAAEQGRAE